jgi:hypothetical protein
MSIPNNEDTQELAKQCVLAVHEHRVEELLNQLRSREIHMTEKEVLAAAEAWSEAWRIYDDSKENCFLCRAPRVNRETLCSCFNDVRVKLYHDPHDVEYIKKLHPDALVETFQCKRCSGLAHMKARHVLAQHRKRGFYKTPRLCMECYTALAALEAPVKKVTPPAIRTTPSWGILDGLEAKIVAVCEGIK